MKLYDNITTLEKKDGKLFLTVTGLNNGDVVNMNLKKNFWKNYPFKILNVDVNAELAIDGANTVKYIIDSKKAVMLPKLLKKYNGKMPYDLCLQLMKDIGNHIHTLEDLDIGISDIELDDIVFINDSNFFYINDNKLTNVKKGEMDIIEPIKKSIFFSPEMKKISSIPAKLHSRSLYFSLAMMVVFCLAGKIEDDAVETIKNTKLYWCIKRMLVNDAKERVFLII
jgi:hypothetical protein